MRTVQFGFPRVSVPLGDATIKKLIRVDELQAIHEQDVEIHLEGIWFAGPVWPAYTSSAVSFIEPTSPRPSCCARDLIWKLW